MYVGGLDLGTTGCKIVIYDDKGAFVDKFYREYNVARSGGMHELDMNFIFESVVEILKEASKYKPLSAIGVTSFGETFAMLDENDEIIAPSMLYTDPRGSEECEFLENTLGKDKISVAVGCMPHPMYSLPKLMWIKNNMPEAYKNAKRVLLAEDFIVYKLTGIAQIDYSLAARTMGFDIRNKCWYEELFSAAGIDSSLLSKPVPSGTVAGGVKADVAMLTGLSGDTKIVSCCQDQIASAIGAGAFTKDVAVDGIGTVECVTIIMDEAPTDAEFYALGYSVVPHIGDKYACYVLSYAGGATLKWFRDSFAEKEREEADKKGENVYKNLDDAMPSDPTEILVMPYFAGAATPFMDTGAKASFIGLTFEHTKLDIYRALMEGTSYEIALNMDVIKKFLPTPSALRATGGGATSDKWLQIKSDILGVGITALNASEVGGAGSAALAGYATGVFSDLKEAVNIMVPERKSFTSGTEFKDTYEKCFNKYKKLYKAIKGLEG